MLMVKETLHMSFFHKDKKEEPVQQDAVTHAEKNQITGENTVAEWLDHPVGGVIFRDMLHQAGQNEGVLKIVRKVTFTQEMLDDMVVKANSGEAPATVTESQTPTETVPIAEPLPEWKEKISTERFAEKTVIVTGAGSGIGRATASRVAREGGRVIAVDISQERLNEFKNQHSDSDITLIVGDITNDDDIAKIVDAAGEQIDALANVAGIMDNMTPLHEMSDNVWNRVMNVNVLGMMKLSRAVLPKMLEKHAGSIVNVGSEASLKASAAGTAYTTSKHAVAGLSKGIYVWAKWDSYKCCRTWCSFDKHRSHL